MQHAGAIGMAGDDPRWRTARAVLAASMSGTSSISISRMLWTRALPGTVAVIAALTLPELSLGAGDLDDLQLVRARAQEPMPADRRPAPSPVPSALAMVPETRPPEGLRTLLAPVVAPDGNAARTPVVEAADFAPEVRKESRPTLAADVGAAAPQAASQPLTADPSKFAAEGAALPIPVETAALARSAAEPEADVALTGSAPEPGSFSQPAAFSEASENMASAAAPTPRAIGGAKRSFAALVPEAAILTAPSLPTGVRDAAPGRRPALEEMPPASAPQAPSQLRVAPEAGTQFAASAPAPAFSAAPAAKAARPASPPVIATPAVVQATSQPAHAAGFALASVPRGMAARSAPTPAARAPVSVPTSAPSVARAAAPAASVPPAASTPVTAPMQAERASSDTGALAALPTPKLQQAAPGLGASNGYQIDIKSQLTTRVDGKAAGKVDFQQTSSGLQVRLGSIVELLGDRYDAVQIARIRASSAGNLYLPLAQLQAQGIQISYDPVYDEFNVGTVDTRPKAARKVHMDQISTPERGIGSTGVDQVRR